ncbi:MAG: PQQ-dependent sugar dehydrogenase [Propionibacteriaceae bacterium]
MSEPSEDTRTAGPTATSSAPTPTPAVSTSASAPTPRPTASATSAKPGKVEADDVVTGLDTPWGLVALKDGTLLVSERDTGKILRVRGDKSSEVTQLGDVQPGGEGGLLGLAVTPDQETVFAYFTAADDNRIVSMSWDGSKLGEPKTILDGIPKGLRHNGGRLVIGPDDLLYVGTGETGDEPLAQDKDSLAGKILRLQLDGDPAPDNPFDNEVYSYGHRNVQGLAFDDQGRLWASEFGDQTWDELNLIKKGANYGWPEAEGSAKVDGLTNPKLVWKTSEASPSGLAYWQGELWMAALRGERLWEIPVDGTDVGDPKSHFADDFGRLRSVTVASDGDSLLLTASNTDGRADPKSGDDRVMRITR